MSHGERALVGERQSLPSLLAISRELANLFQRDYTNAPAAQGYFERLNSLSTSR